MHTYTNRLISETSPYLLQHAHNPVNWYPWGDEALNRAKAENKPVLISIGYAACHWCHVMERESFEDEVTAAFMNAHFINIKIDREERPDLDHIYMDAVQAMTGSGGWPLNVFLTPDKKPFYGGTYFPPQRAFNRASWLEVLQGIVQAYNEKRDEIEKQADGLTDHLLQSNAFGIQTASADAVFSPGGPNMAFRNTMATADREWGGFGRAPKFPQSFTIQFLIRYHYVTRNEEALQQALLSLDKMIEGGIYDQLGGGFARYSTDTEWLAPHFEKMLYDNALLVTVLSEACKLTGSEKYRKVIDATMAFVKREMLHPEQGFYSALDADSEGEEGKFYVWSKEEVDEVLGGRGTLFCSYYAISERGNWEGKNILCITKELRQLAAENNMSPADMEKQLDEDKSRLLSRRNTRVRPLLDDKIILGWNALMNTACSKAFEATGEESYRQLAVANMSFLLEKLAVQGQAGFYHTWKSENAKYPAFLDDYAFLVQALINLYEITANTRWLLKAKEITEYVLMHFSEEEAGSFFYFTGKGQRDVILRKKEVYDGAVASGNAVMAGNLYLLAVFFDKPEWKERSFKMVRSLGHVITKYPTSFGAWNVLLLQLVAGTEEVAIGGRDTTEMHQQVLAAYIPHRVLMTFHTEEDAFPLLKGKAVTDPPSVYLCRNFACSSPIYSISELIRLINNERGGK